ncbi:hypothetical protein BCR44DRAFT_1187567 [Catenaria anguillulae PL171]|uniref:Uncharacterized protein n=1 Tax=Catenaria anguillulae PL171 TaxID=765915 RepID=A0A1Y2H3N7_9FUNG|nr:hypothetical protein BCR44DRAFT_1187567 [Catenaria anguillulae PL171]
MTHPMKKESNDWRSAPPIRSHQQTIRMTTTPNENTNVCIPHKIAPLAHRTSWTIKRPIVQQGVTPAHVSPANYSHLTPTVPCRATACLAVSRTQNPCVLVHTYCCGPFGRFIATKPPAHFPINTAILLQTPMQAQLASTLGPIASANSLTNARRAGPDALAMDLLSLCPTYMLNKGRRLPPRLSVETKSPTTTRRNASTLR